MQAQHITIIPAGLENLHKLNSGKMEQCVGMYSVSHYNFFMHNAQDGWLCPQMLVKRDVACGVLWEGCKMQSV